MQLDQFVPFHVAVVETVLSQVLAQSLSCHGRGLQGSAENETFLT